MTKSFRTKSTGWFRESFRHSLAARGIASRSVGSRRRVRPDCVRKEILVGGRGDCRSDSAFKKESLAEGTLHELEHTQSVAVAKEIAKDHLSEDPEYYVKLRRLEKDNIKMRDLPARKSTLHGIPVVVKPLQKGYVYPVTPHEVVNRLRQLPKTDVAQVKSVEFVEPQGYQRGAYAQYVRGRKALLVFGHAQSRTGKIGGEDPASVRLHFQEYVIPHEVGHAVALNGRKITDKRLSTAEARADAYAYTMDVEDRSVKRIADRVERDGRGKIKSSEQLKKEGM
jgi:hypothetical protein